MENQEVLELKAKTQSRRKGMLKKYGVLLLFLLPFLLAFTVFFLVPLIYGVYISLTNFKYGSPGTEHFNQFQWYKIIFDSGFKGGKIYHDAFWRSFANSLIFAVIMVPIAIIVPLALAILVNSKPKGYKMFRALIYMPSIVPLTAAGAVFTMLFLEKSQHGLINEIFGLEINWFKDVWFRIPRSNGKPIEVYYAWIPIFLMCLWGGWGSNFIILTAGLQNVPRSLYEASDIDGCSKWKKILHVTIPGIKSQLVLCLFTTIIGYLGLYGQNFVLSNGGPGQSAVPGGGGTSTIMYFIQDIVANMPDLKSRFYGLGAAASLVFALFTGIISGTQMYLTRDKKSGKKISEDYLKWQRIK